MWLQQDAGNSVVLVSPRKKVSPRALPIRGARIPNKNGPLSGRGFLELFGPRCKCATALLTRAHRKTSINFCLTRDARTLGKDFAMINIDVVGGPLLLCGSQSHFKFGKSCAVGVTRLLRVTASLRQTIRLGCSGPSSLPERAKLFSDGSHARV